MTFSKKEIEMARERNALQIGRKKFGSKVKSIEQLDFSKPIKFTPLGEKLVKIAERRLQ